MKRAAVGSSRNRAGRGAGPTERGNPQLSRSAFCKRARCLAWPPCSPVNLTPPAAAISWRVLVMRRLSPGSIGSTTGGSWSPSATSRLPKPKSPSMPCSRLPLWRRDSNQMASGKPGAVQSFFGKCLKIQNWRALDSRCQGDALTHFAGNGRQRSWIVSRSIVRSSTSDRSGRPVAKHLGPCRCGGCSLTSNMAASSPPSVRLARAQSDAGALLAVSHHRSSK